MITFVLDTPTNLQVKVHGALRAKQEYCANSDRACFSIDPIEGGNPACFITFECPVIRVADDRGITEIKG